MDKQAKKTKRTKPRHKYIEGSLIYRHLIVHYALMRPTPVLNENDINFLLNRVEDEVKGITTYLRKVPSDYKHLERWFALMEDNATTNKQRCVLKQLKEHFEQLKQQPTPQDETTSSQLLAAQVEDAGGEVETGTKQFEITLPFKEQALDKLYDLMITEEVFSSSITKDTFFKCIDSANFKVIWDKQKKPEKTKRNQLRCVIRYLKDHYKSVWIECAAKKLGMTDKKKLTAFNRQSMGDFENKVTNLLA